VLLIVRLALYVGCLPLLFLVCSAVRATSSALHPIPPLPSIVRWQSSGGNPSSGGSVLTHFGLQAIHHTYPTHQCLASTGLSSCPGVVRFPRSASITIATMSFESCLWGFVSRHRRASVGDQLCHYNTMLLWANKMPALHTPALLFFLIRLFTWEVRSDCNKPNCTWIDRLTWRLCTYKAVTAPLVYARLWTVLGSTQRAELRDCTARWWAHRSALSLASAALARAAAQKLRQARAICRRTV